MSKQESCAFCHPSQDLIDRTVHETDEYRLFVSAPRVKGHRYHLLATPTADHYTELHEVPPVTLGRMIGELALISSWIHGGRGYVLGQKHQPLQTENGVKMNHVHMHSLPRTKEDEQNGILFPLPQTFDDFDNPDTPLEKTQQSEDISLIRRELEILYKVKVQGIDWSAIRAEYGTE